MGGAKGARGRRSRPFRKKSHDTRRLQALKPSWLLSSLPGYCGLRGFIPWIIFLFTTDIDGLQEKSDLRGTQESGDRRLRRYQTSRAAAHFRSNPAPGRRLPARLIFPAAPGFQGFHQVVGELLLAGHGPQGDFRLVEAVVVGAAGDQEVKLLGQLQVQGNLFRGVLGVENFQPRQPQAFELDDQVFQGDRPSPGPG